MARAAKKEKATKTLTPEEKLAAALLPVEEQPYPVPENWCWTYLGYISEIIMGQSPEGSATTDDSAYIPLVGGASDMGELYPTASRYTKSPTKTSKVDDIIVCIRATLGRPVFSNRDYCLGRGVAALRNYSGYKELYRYGLINFEQYLYDNATGTTFAQVSSAVLQRMPFPLIPFPEQQRIVDRIESLFAKLDEAKEKAQVVVDSFEDRKAAILYNAFSGEFTNQWRKEKGISRSSWEVRNLQFVCSVKITDGTHKTPTYCDAGDGFPFISAKDVTTGVICWDNIKYITPELHEELYERLAPQIDDVLLAKNGTTGVAAIVDVDKVFDLYVTLAVLRPDKSIIIPRYLLNVVNSPICKKQFDDHLTGIGVPNLHLRDIKQVEIPLPSLAEQSEIVLLIDKLLAKEQQSKEAAEQALAQIDTMKKSILARAFRGELGTNDPTDESAEELLKQIL